MKTIYIKLTNDCNLRCKHCYLGDVPHNVMGTHTYQNIMEKLDRMRIAGEKFEVILHGGEPLMHFMDPVFVNSFRTMNALNIPVTMTTNLVCELTTFKREVIGYMRPSKDSKPFICTSWDKDIRFTREGMQELWENNVKDLLSSGVDIQVIVTVTKILIDTMTPDELFSYFKGLGFSKINFERLTVTGRAAKNKELIPTNKAMRKWLYDAYVVNKEKYNFSIPLFENLEWAKKGVYNGCRARQCSKNVITYNPDGSVATCPNISGRIIAYMGRATSATEAIKVLSCETTCKQICAEEQTRHNECYTCPHFGTCNGDCFQLSWDKTGCPGLVEIMEVL